MILHVFNTSIVSGPETLVIPQLKAVSRALETSVGVLLLLEKRRSEVENQAVISFVKSHGVEPFVVYVKGRVDRSAVDEVLAIVQKQGVELLHAHDVKASWYALAVVKKLRAVSHSRQLYLISTHHGVRNRAPGRARLYAWWYEHRVLPLCDRVIAVCESDAQLLRERGVFPGKIRVQRNGVTRTKTLVAGRRDFAHKLRAELGLPTQALVMAYVGRMSQEKGLSELLSMLKSFKEQCSGSWCCLMVGSGKDQVRFSTEAKEAGLDAHIRWLGYRSDSLEIMQGCDFVLSCSAAEGLPISLIEAGWAGACVAANRVDGICELLPNEEFGLPWRLQDTPQRKAEALVRLVTNEKGRETVARRYQKWIQEQFSGERWVECLVEIYRDCIPKMNLEAQVPH